MEEAPARIRKIRTSDLKEILEISSQVWGGHDYLPSVIDEWLASPKCHTYGVEVDGHIVAVGNLRLVDRGKTGWMEGLRVHIDHRRRGYADMLTRRFVSLGKKLKVKRLRYTTASRNRASTKLAKNAGFKRLFKMSIFWHESLKAVAETLHTRSRLREATTSEANETLRANPGIVPHNTVVYDWKAVEGTRAAFKEIGKDHKFYVVKKKCSPRSFSIGRAGQNSESDWWSFTICASDEDEFLVHFKNHLRIALEIGSEAAVCTTMTQFDDAFGTEKPLKLRGKMQLIMFEKQMK